MIPLQRTNSRAAPAPQPRQAPAVSVPIARLLVLSYFASSAPPRLLRAAQLAELPPDGRVYVGSYGVGPAPADRIEGPLSRRALSMRLNTSICSTFRDCP